MCTCSLKGSSTVMVMDSMALFLSLNNSTILQISKIYRVPNCNFTLEIRTVSVQQQKGSSDCGVFAVAYAVEVCLGRNPQYARFDQTRMRNHLYECLTGRYLRVLLNRKLEAGSSTVPSSRPPVGRPTHTSCLSTNPFAAR